MSKLQEIIKKRLEKPMEPVKKQYSVSLRPEQVEKMDAIARTMSAKTGAAIGRNALVEDAVDAFIEEALATFKRESITLVTENTPRKTTVDNQVSADFDTAVFPGKPDGFQQTFLGEKQWYYVRPSQERIPHIRYIAVYIGKPVQEITHYAKVKEFVPDEATGKYRVLFDGDPVPLKNPVPLGNISGAATRAPRYTTISKLLTAAAYGDL